MKLNSIHIGLTIALFFCWVFPVYGVIYNQAVPSYESALGVAFTFFLGCIIHLVVLLVWFGIRRAKAQKIEWKTLLISFCIMIVLTILSNFGWLSRVNP